MVVPPILVLIFVFLLVVALAGGWMGRERFGIYGWSPLGCLLALILVLWLTGHLH